MVLDCSFSFLCKDTKRNEKFKMKNEKCLLLKKTAHDAIRLIDTMTPSHRINMP